MRPRRRDQAPLRVNERVEVCSEEEILATLDERGELNGMPFMPEMLQFAGKRFYVSKRAHKTCDGHGGIRQLAETVHLEDLRCDGAAHNGCQARCLLFWNQSWLRPIQEERLTPVPARTPAIDVETLHAATRRDVGDGAVRYACQATEVAKASEPLPIWKVGQYVEDWRSGNWPLGKVVRVVARQAFNKYQNWSQRHLPPRLRFRGGTGIGRVQGSLRRTPRIVLGLQPGDRVRVKPLDEIVATLDANNSNRGLQYDVEEEAKWSGREGVVLDSVDHFIDDLTGEMVEVRSDCHLLDGMVCTGDHYRLCPRGLYPFWREAWLERAEPSEQQAGDEEAAPNPRLHDQA